MEKAAIYKHMESSPVLKFELRLVLFKVYRNRSTGPDEILIMRLKVIGDLGIGKVIKMISEINISCKMTGHLSRYRFLVMKKNFLTSNETPLNSHLDEPHNLSHITKLITGILMNAVRRKMKLKMEQG